MEEVFRVFLIVSLLAAGTVCHGFRVKFEKKGLLRALRSGDAFGDKPGNVFFKDLVPDPEIPVRLGQSLVLDCEAGGSPTPTIHWTFNDKKIPQGTMYRFDDDEASMEYSPRNQRKPRLQFGATKSRLYIDCVTPEHIGEYKCVADIPDKRITHASQLVLEDMSENIVDTCMMKRLDTGRPARAYMWTAQRLEYQGRDVQLFCRADGFPKPTVTWFDGKGQEITPDNMQYTVLENGDLFIRKVTFKENMGLYECRVNNGIGQDSVKTFLYPTKE
jgi:hypothetical protein